MPPSIDPLLTAFWKTLTEEVGGKFLSGPDARRDAEDLSHQLTEGRGHLKPNYLNSPQRLGAYAAAYMPMNFQKTLLLLRAHKPIMGPAWLDFGCGPGTAILAALAYAAETKQPMPREIHLVESQTAPRTLAMRMVRTYARHLNLMLPTVREWQRIPTRPPGGLSIAFAASVLNELPDGRPLERLWSDVSGTFLIIEPGHRVSSQKLIRLRERLRQEKAYILGPCTHEGHCPLLRTKHWCHFSEPVEDEQLINMNQTLFGDNRPWLKFSYLFLSRTPQPPRDQQYRAIGDLHLSGPGMVAIDLCAPDNKKPIKFPRTAPPELLDALVRGSLVTLSAHKVDSVNEVSHLNYPDAPAWQRKNHRT